MAEKKTAAHAQAGIQSGSGTTPAAHQVTAVTDESMQRAYEALMADLSADDFLFESLPNGGAEYKKAELFGPELGSTLKDPAIIARFEGVKENLEREIKGGMCTPDQAYAYLENLEITLLMEQESALTS